MIFSSAGHCNARGHKNEDSGAVGVNGRWEADESVKLRNRVNQIIRSSGYTVKQDSDSESLSEYLNRIQPGPASVVVEYHFDCADSPKATGCSALVADGANEMSKSFGKELAEAVHTVLGIRLRDGDDGDGILFESDSHRGRLGLMREAGTVALLEICFISNPSDMALYDAHFEQLAEAIAQVIIKYEDKIR